MYVICMNSVLWLRSYCIYHHEWFRGYSDTPFCTFFLCWSTSNQQAPQTDLEVYSSILNPHIFFLFFTFSVLQMVQLTLEMGSQSLELLYFPPSCTQAHIVRKYMYMWSIYPLFCVELWGPEAYPRLLRGQVRVHPG